MAILKYIKSNLGFLIMLTFVAVVAFSPKAKSLVMRGLIKTGLFEADVSGLEPKPASTKEVAEVLPVVKSTLFNSLDGKTIDLAQLKGKVVFLNFWATWCPPCVAEMPSINGLYNKLKDNKDIVFIMADADGNLQTADRFMKKKGYDLPVYTPAGTVSNEIFTGGLPTTLIINKRGEIIYNEEGMADYSSLEIVKLLSDLSQ